MNKLLACLICVSVLLMAGAKPVNTVTLTALEVVSGSDIEQAILLATGYGSHPGTVILDSSEGDFVFSEADKTINIFVSDVTLMSKNAARIIDCEGAINFDAVPAHNVTIEGIQFICSGDGFFSSGYYNSGIKILNNLISVPGYGLDLGSIGDSTIKNNVIQAGTGIHISDTSNQVRIQRNWITAESIGIFLHDVDQNQVVNNQIRAGWQGVLLGNGSDKNMVTANKISNVNQSGIALEGNNHNNQIHGNRVACAPESACLVIDASIEGFGQNNIHGNR